MFKQILPTRTRLRRTRTLILGLEGLNKVDLKYSFLIREAGFHMVAAIAGTNVQQSLPSCGKHSSVIVVKCCDRNHRLSVAFIWSQRLLNVFFQRLQLSYRSYGNQPSTVGFCFPTLYRTHLNLAWLWKPETPAVSKLDVSKLEILRIIAFLRLIATFVIWHLERFSNECRKTKTIVIYSTQSQQTQITQWNNQNSKQIHVTGAKRGKTWRSVWVLLLIGRESGARFFDQS